LSDEQPRTFLRIDGFLWQNMVFEQTLGWETTTADVLPEVHDRTYRLELMDERGRVLVSVPVDVRFRDREIGLQDEEPTLAGRSVAYATVHAYVPLHPEGRQLVLCRDDVVIHRVDVAPAPPRVAIRESEAAGEDAWRVSWEADHSSPLTFDVSYIYGPGAVLTLARGLAEREFVADLSSCPGGDEASLAVLAADGTRSAFALTAPFRVRDKPPVIWIQAPSEEHALPPDQPVSLVGQAVDLAGATLPVERLVWRIDGNDVESGASVAMATGLEPGPHVVELAYEDGSGAQARVEITVAERNPEATPASEVIRRALRQD
jgi:hypothetical protein